MPKKGTKKFIVKKWLDIFGALWACLCVYRRWQQCASLWEHNALVCGFDKYWQCVWEMLSYCAGISRTMRCVNAKAKKKGVGEQETNKQTNKDGSTGWQAEQLTAANNWWQILILSFMFFAPLRGLSLFLFFFYFLLFYFVVLKSKVRCKMPNNMTFASTYYTVWGLTWMLIQNKNW